MNVICWFSTRWPFSPSLVLLHNSSASLMNVFLVISDQGGVPPDFPTTHSVTHCLNGLLLPFSSFLCTHKPHRTWISAWLLVWHGVYLCVCARECGSCGKLQKGVHVYQCNYAAICCHLHTALCVLCSQYMRLYIWPHACAWWTNVNPCVWVRMCVCVWKRESVCVHVCAADVLCSVLFPRLAGLCCCSLVQTGLATCFYVCKDKPHLRRFNLSIAAAKSRL